MGGTELKTQQYCSSWIALWGNPVINPLQYIHPVHAICRVWHLCTKRTTKL